MDVRIGLVYSARDLELELPDDTDVDALRSALGESLTGDAGVVWLTDKRGNQVGVAAGKITFVQIGGAGESGRIGFG